MRQRAPKEDPAVGPVTKVVNLLKVMKEELEKEATIDKEVYDRYAAWCRKNDGGKTAAIEEGEQRVAHLGQAIERNIALSEKLKVDIRALDQELATGRQALEEAIALRRKQKDGFADEEKQLVESLRALDAALVVLSKHQVGALVSVNKVISQVVQTLQRTRGHGSVRFAAPIDREKNLVALGQGLQGPTFKAPYQPQSSQVYGILKQMKETFAGDLSASQAEEIEAQKTFEALKAAKEAEIRSAELSLQDKKQQLAHADDTVVEGKTDRDDTGEVIAKDKAFLSELRTKCALTDHEWERRQKLRQDEVDAVTKAIGLLTTDEARSLFSDVLDKAPVFFQLLTGKRRRRAQVAEVLQKIAAKHHDARFFALVSGSGSDAFIRVKKAIDDLVAELLREAKQDIAHRDVCVSDLSENQRFTAKEEHHKDELNAKLQRLEQSKNYLAKDIEKLQSDISVLEGEFKKAHENREKEKAQFDTILADQQAAQRLLEEAVHVLELRYLPKTTKESSFLRTRSGGGREDPPTGFKKYKNNGQVAGVLSLLKHIIEDCKALQKETRLSESQAQDEYTVLMQSTTESVVVKRESIADKQAEKAKVDEDISQTRSELKSSLSELDVLSKSKADLAGGCEFLLNNFEARSKARSEEIQALREAKSFLSGMS